MHPGTSIYRFEGGCSQVCNGYRCSAISLKSRTILLPVFARGTRLASLFVTGASGFVGRHLCKRAQGHSLSVLTRAAGVSPGARCFDADLTSTDFSWFPADVDCVIHLAGRAHKLEDSAVDPLQQFRLVNRDATLRLAREAYAKGVKRFVFVSSIGVHGNATLPGQPFMPDSDISPDASYAVSKAEAEQELVKFCDQVGMEWVIVRPPLVYGEDAPGNFARLLGLVARRYPLPFGNTRNARSLISVRNLADFLLLSCVHPAAARQSFTVADDSPLDTGEMIERLASGMGHSPVLFSVPKKAVKLMSKVFGKPQLYQQLFGDLVVDNSKARRLLGWEAQERSEVALRNAAHAWVLRERR